MLREFFLGVRAPFRAVGLLRRQKSLRRLAVQPLLINMLLFIVGVPLTVWLAIGLVPDVGSGVITGILRVVVAIAVIGASAFLFVAIGTVIAAPFNSKLAAEVERLHTGLAIPDTEGLLGGTVRSIWTSLGRLFLFLMFYPIIFATQFIPVLGFALYPVLTILYGSFVLCFDLSDPAMERHMSRFREKVRFIMRHKARHLGFGLVCLGMALIPGINLLVLPVCVTAGAALFVEHELLGQRPTVALSKTP